MTALSPLVFTITEDGLPQDARTIRENIFIEEQKFSNEFDAIDDYATHILCYMDGKLCGYARIYPDDDKSTFHLGRVCIVKECRKMKLGSKIMNKAEEVAIKKGATKIELSAQCRVIPFYMSLGYTTEGEEYFDEWCPHIKMVKQLVSSR